MDERFGLDLRQSNEIMDLFGELQTANDDAPINAVAELQFPKKGSALKSNEMCFYRVERLSFDEDYPHREAFENVLLSINNRAFNFVYVLTGTEEGVELCIGVVQNQNENLPVLGKKLSAVNYGEIIENIFEGNFSGSKLRKLKASELEKLIGEDIQKYKNAGVITGIPSVNEKEAGGEYDFQGIDRLVNSMLGLEWRLVVVCEPVSKKEAQEIREDIYELYNRLSVYSKRTVQHQESSGDSFSFGTNKSKSTGRNWGTQISNARTENRDTHDEHSSSSNGNQYTEGKNKGWSSEKSEGSNKSVSKNRSISNSETLEIANKHAQEMMKYIDESLLERLNAGCSKGMFKTSVYYMAKEPAHTDRLKVGIMSLFQGGNSTYSPLRAQSIDLRNAGNLPILKSYQNQYLIQNNSSDDALNLIGRPFYYDGRLKYVGLNSYLTTNEISLIAGLPQKEVPGLSLKENVEFGLNEKQINEDKGDKKINIGFLVQQGRELKNLPFYLSKNSLSKHTFIAGVTGSGKTTTCHRLLSASETPFLVIEPAKTEYRTLIKKDENLVVFTLGNETVAPFRINPFELVKGEIISSHIDMVKATFCSAFPMEGSMPQLLEEAILKCYEDKGWNIDTNENEIGDKAFDPKANKFPILSDLLKALEKIVDEKKFGNRLGDEYKGSLVSRLSNLTKGAKGSMLNCKYSTDFNFIINNNVILEMEELKSPEDKALLMGFVLSRLSTEIRKAHKEDSDFKHLTLVEEAHRLLSKPDYGDSGAKKSAVETFTDLLAEVRKYGEGLIIVDQIPNKLAPEVLKNTNTKIIHKILARDDKEVVGDTMLMDDKQKEYLSALEVGNAIVFTEKTDKPVHVHIERITDTNEDEIEDDVVKERFEQFKPHIGGFYESPEVLELYPLFSKVIGKVEQIAKKKGTDYQGFELLKEKINDASKNHGKGVEQIWSELVNRWLDKSGTAAGNQDKIEEIAKELMDFFANIFCKENFSDKDIRTAAESVGIF